MRTVLNTVLHTDQCILLKDLSKRVNHEFDERKRDEDLAELKSVIIRKVDYASFTFIAAVVVIMIVYNHITLTNQYPTPEDHR